MSLKGNFRLTLLNSETLIWCLFFALVSVSSCWGRSAVQGRDFENKEYSFRVSIPNGLPVCVGESGTHPHGVGTRLDKKSCDEKESGPAFSIWADYNAAFQVNALVRLQNGTSCGNSTVAWAQQAWQSIGGLKTAMCQVQHSDGKVEIVLASQAGRWGPSFGDEKDLPRINYTVYLYTTKSRMNDDIELFRAFLKSIKISEAS